MTDPRDVAKQVAEFGKVYTRWIQSVLQAEVGTTPARSRLLGALQCHGACKMSQLGEELGVTPRSITKLVDALEDEALVMRAPHPEDRRATLVHLTAEGILAAKETVLAHDAAFEKLYARLPESDRAHLVRILGGLLDEIRRQEETEQPTAGA